MRDALYSFTLLLAASPAAQAYTHEVKMLNRNACGSMVYEPDFVEAVPDDIVKFINRSSGHNAVTIDGVVPDGHPGFRGKINEEIEVKLDQEGF